jgi:Ca2+-binding RTX toxin-like protein
VIGNTGDIVQEGSGPGSGFDVVYAAVNHTLADNIEEMVLSGTGRTGTGNGGANIFINTGGENTMAGAGGNDVYYVAHSGDQVSEAALEGIDTVVSQVSYTLADNVENLFLYGSGNIDGTGNSGVNGLYSNAGNNTLTGAGGFDAFVFVSPFGDDHIADYDAGGNFIVFATSLFADAADVFNHMADDGNGHAVITLGADTITFDTVSTAQLMAHQSDFLFV